MPTEEIKIDLTEVKERKSRNSIKNLIEETGFPFKVFSNFWSHFEEKENDITRNAIVISDLHSTINHCKKINQELWKYKVQKNKPYFISIIRNKRDERVADLIDNLLKISNNRLTVIKTTKYFSKKEDHKELLDKLQKIIARNFNPDALEKVSFNKSKDSFIIEFNDASFGEVSLKELDIQSLKNDLLLDSVQISDQGNAIELFTKKGEIFDIDAQVLKSFISTKTRDKIKNDAELTAQNVGNQIKAARKMNNLTQENLSELTNIDQAIISKIETGKHLPRFDTISRIANGLDITVSELLNIR
ncbi:MAG TPA: helix-turn-helix transcriptional regulator [Balneolaceae bacterium]|nr:helix-turn-helix transcriptional regulator [Balneolaceae bacterium]